MATATQYSQVPATHTKENYVRPLAFVALVFFLWGFLTCLGETLLPRVKSIFDMSSTELMLTEFGFFFGYLVFSVPAARLVDRIGYQRTMMASFVTMAVGTLLIVPGTSIPSYAVFVVALVLVGAGMAALQVSANPYVTILGPAESATSRLMLIQAFDSTGMAMAPSAAAIMVLSSAPVTQIELESMSPEALHYYRMAQAASIRVPYLLAGLSMVVLAVLVGTCRLPDIVSAGRRPGRVLSDRLWNHPNLIYGVIGMFACVGADVALTYFGASYVISHKILHVSGIAVTALMPIFWLCGALGRFLAAGLLRTLKPKTVLAIAILGATVMAAIAMASTGAMVLWVSVAAGFFSAVIFPCVFSMGIAGMGPLTGDASGLLISAMVGGAAIPALQSLLASRVGLQHALLLPIFCYVYLLFYVWKIRKGDRSVGATA